ncbi:hypothetical protein HDU82_002070 [Entophlyctis luteolus]|nr:hypothetical protein HDU82_002070 [Entophlyctis luteolus]
MKSRRSHLLPRVVVVAAIAAAASASASTQHPAMTPLFGPYWALGTWATHAGPSSSASLSLAQSGFNFSGELRVLPAAGAFASAIAEPPKHLHDLSNWQNIVVNVAHGDGHFYSLSLRNPVAQPGDVESPIVFRHVFKTVAGMPSTHLIPLSTLVPYKRGHVVETSDPAAVFDKTKVDAIYLTCASLYGRQEGKFMMVLKSLELDSGADELYLFGGAERSWRPSSWTEVTDNLLVGGTSVAKFELIDGGRRLKFFGTLNLRKDSGVSRAFASIVSDRRYSSKYSSSAPFWDFSLWAALTVSVARGDGKAYSVNLHSAAESGFEHSFVFQTINGEASAHTVLLSQLASKRLGEDIEGDKAVSLVRAISLKCASMGGKQEGDFELIVDGIYLSTPGFGERVPLHSHDEL